MSEIESEYQKNYKYIKFIAIDTWKEVDPEMTWENWVSDNECIAINLSNNTCFFSESSFLCGAFGYNPIFAQKLVRYFYITENNIIKKKY
jgi:hypothetical protein